MKYSIAWYCTLILLALSSCTNTEKINHQAINQHPVLPPFNRDILSIYETVETAYPGSTITNTISYINSIEKCLGKPALIPEYAERITDMLTATSNNTEILSLLHRLNDISAGGYGPPLSGGTTEPRRHMSADKIKDDIEFLCQTHKAGGLGLMMQESTLEEIMNMGEQEQILLVDVLYLLAHVNSIFSNYISYEEMPEEFIFDCNCTLERIDWLLEPFHNAEILDNRHKKTMRLPDKHILAFSSRVLIQGIEKILKSYKYNIDSSDRLQSSIILETELGSVAIFGNGADTIKKSMLLTIDLGGDDYYTENCATADGTERPISIVIDMNGNDTYGSPGSKDMVCSSIYGLSVLIDRKGDDKYNGGRYNQAFSYGGFSMLIDETGDDKYLCHTFSQACSFFGYSALVDRSGKDYYSSGSYSQGFGGPGGIGLLIELEGDDELINESGSFCQGSAKGRWADAGDGFSIGGGYGILINISGDDKYLARSFSQGASYFHGMGILSDLTGNDTYDAISHSQGSAIHFTLAYFSDKEGNDKYNENIQKDKLTQITGYARDHSYSYFSDLKGNDKYHFGNKSYGVGDIEAIASTIDLLGNDSYFWHKNEIYSGYDSFGSAQGLEGTGMAIAKYPLLTENKITAGIAIDGQGIDEYKIIVPGMEDEVFFKDNKSLDIITDRQISIRSDK